MMLRYGSTSLWGSGALLLALVVVGPIARADDPPATARGAWVGVTTRALTDAWRESKNYTASGVMVVEVAPGGPADQVGVSPGDVLVTIDSRTLRSPSDLAAAEAAMEPGRAVEVILARDGGRNIRIFNLEPARAPAASSAPAPTPAESGAAGAGAGAGGAPAGEIVPVPPVPGDVSITTGPEDAGAAPSSPAPISPSPATSGTDATMSEPVRNAATGLGVRCENLTFDLATAMKVPAGKGVLVLAVNTGSAADKAGIRPGDVIARVGGQPVPDVDALDEILANATSPTSIVATRNGTSRVVAADLDKPVVPAPPVETAVAPATEPKPAEQTQEQIMASLRDEVRSLRDELRKLREEMANWARASRPQP